MTELRPSNELAKPTEGPYSVRPAVRDGRRVLEIITDRYGFVVATVEPDDPEMRATAEIMAQSYQQERGDEIERLQQRIADLQQYHDWAKPQIEKPPRGDEIERLQQRVAELERLNKAAGDMIVKLEASDEPRAVTDDQIDQLFDALDVEGDRDVVRRWLGMIGQIQLEGECPSCSQWVVLRSDTAEMAEATPTKEELCSECRKPLPPLAQWSMPACPECVDKADKRAHEPPAAALTPAKRGGQDGYEVTINGFVEWFVSEEMAREALRRAAVETGGSRG